MEKTKGQSREEACLSTCPTGILFATNSRARAALLLCVMLQVACAGTRAPTANEQTHVSQVEIVRHDLVADSDFALHLHEAVIREAALYGDAGRPIDMRIEITRLHFKNPLKALTLGDDNSVIGQVSIVDPTTRQQTSTFSVRANADRSGVSGTSIALTVAGIVEPTGLVSMGEAVAGAMSADLNRRGTARAMSANLAAEILRQTYGDARAKDVAKGRQAREKAL